MKKVGKTLVPRLPLKALQTMKKGARHEDKRKKKPKHQNQNDPADEPTRPQFFTHKLDIL